MRAFGIFDFTSRVMLATAATFIAIPQVQQARAGSTSLLVPAYVYPSGAGRAAWDQLADTARTIPVEAILNPGSGPGAAADPNYAAVVDTFRKAGGKVLGYVDSAYGKRPSALVEKDIRSYLGFYPVDGFFIDQMANTKEAVAYYESIYRIIKKLNPNLRVVGNPGTPYTLPAYLNAADTLVLFEGPASSYANYKPFSPAPWIADHPPGRFANIVYDVRAQSGLADVLAKARQTNAGILYITDKKLPNPYSGLPAYWKDATAAIRGQDALVVTRTAASVTGSPPVPRAPATPDVISPPATTTVEPVWTAAAAVATETSATDIAIGQRPYRGGLLRRLLRPRLDRSRCQPATVPGFVSPAGR